LPAVAPVVSFLLPERRRLPGAPPPWLAKAFKQLRASDPVVAPGEEAQVARYFEADAAALPTAAIQRHAEARDAGEDCWIRADPVWLRPDQGGVRLVACDSLGLSAGEADALLEAVAAALSEFGVDVGRTGTERWYMRLPTELAPPTSAWPADVLGADVLPHLPGGASGRTWSRILVEAQVTLHQHPVNAARLQSGRAPANSLWFWGGGRLARIRSSARRVLSREPLLCALADWSGVNVAEPASPVEKGDLVDARRARDWDAVGDALQPLFGLRHAGTRIVLDFADGCQAVSRPWRRLPRWAGSRLPGVNGA
jgi:hypothetical protein